MAVRSVKDLVSTYLNKTRELNAVLEMTKKSEGEGAAGEKADRFEDICRRQVSGERRA